MREVNTMCESSKMTNIGVKMANHYFHKISQNMRAYDICEIIDKNGITLLAYSIVYKKFRGAAKLVSKRLWIAYLSNLSNITKVRQMLNLKLCDYIEEYKFINNTL